MHPSGDTDKNSRWGWEGGGGLSRPEPVHQRLCRSEWRRSWKEAKCSPNQLPRISRRPPLVIFKLGRHASSHLLGRAIMNAPVAMEEAAELAAPPPAMAYPLGSSKSNILLLRDWLCGFAVAICFTVWSAKFTQSQFEKWRRHFGSSPQRNESRKKEMGNALISHTKNKQNREDPGWATCVVLRATDHAVPLE